MRRPLLVIVLLLAAAAPASAHRLKLFAAVADGTISGYGFFIGGGRPQAATLLIRDAAGAEVFRGTTDAKGAFAWRPPRPADFTLTLDARDGHVAEATIDADRFGGTPVGALAAASEPAEKPAPAAAGPDPALIQAIDSAVDAAVARQVRPLLEAYAEADGRIRFNDVIGGVGMIVGLAGAALWASGRKRRTGGAP